MIWGGSHNTLEAITETRENSYVVDHITVPLLLTGQEGRRAIPSLPHQNREAEPPVTAGGGDTDDE